MCCQETEVLGLPPEVLEAQERYRRWRAERGWDWGAEGMPDLFHWARFGHLDAVFAAFDTDWAAAVRSVIAPAVPPGVVLVRVGPDGALAADPGPARPAVAGRPTRLDVVVDSAADRTVVLTVAGREVPVEPDGVALVTVDLDVAGPDLPVALDGRILSVPAVRPAPAAALRLASSRCARWSVTDASGGAWFPDGVPRKWDVHHRPFFHGHEVTVPVPAVPLHVVCTRGLEFGTAEADVHPAAGETRTVDLDPPRLADPAADGWYGGDLHVHLNYSGDLVCSVPEALRMQRGEGLHLMNLVAGNLTTSLVYDRELLEQLAGTDLPGSTGGAVARAGVEFRNDLLGHVHALGPAAAPTRYQTGHEGTENPDDWPPNAVACAELRELGATVGYAHPSATAFPDDWSTDRFFANPRSVEARELVADAALGLVDSVDLVSPFDDAGAAFLYHRLLSCGLRLAATAGTDAFLSFSHGPDVASNPPGWGRVYAHLRGEPFSVPAFQDAVRAGRTVVTNGPWLTIDVDGDGPGAVLDRSPGDRLTVRARVGGIGAQTLVLVGADGILAEGDPGAELRHEVVLDGPTWLAAVARGPGHPQVLDASAFAHTSPVYVDVAGRPVARAADARWCLAFLDTFEAFVRRHGRTSREGQLADLADLVERARAVYRGVLGRADR